MIVSSFSEMMIGVEFFFVSSLFLPCSPYIAPIGIRARYWASPSSYSPLFSAYISSVSSNLSLEGRITLFEHEFEDLGRLLRVRLPLQVSFAMFPVVITPLPLTPTTNGLFVTISSISVIAKDK